jgi:predicted amidohydrolase YtcJ
VQQRLAALEFVQPLLHGLGITGVIDPAAVPAELSAYQQARQRGLLTMRVVAMPYLAPGPEMPRRLEGTGVRTGFGDDMLRLGGIKVYFDGQGRAGQALLRDPWPGVPGDYHGEQLISTEDFTELMVFCARERWSAGVHCAGGGAIDTVLAVFAAADRVAPIRDLRFQLIHAYLEPSRENMALARELGVVAALQPSIQLRNGAGVFSRLGERGVRSTPIRSWFDAGVTVAGGSDAPDFPFDPLHWMWQARTRMVDGLDAPLGPGEAVSAPESLAMATTHAAYASFAEDRRGSLRPGMLADWVALSADPSTCDPEALRGAKVLRTVVGGRTVFSRG